MLKMLTRRKRLFFTLLILSVVLIPLQAVHSQSPVVHAVLFYSPSCPHCHTVMTEDLPPLQRTYGENLDILQVDTSTVEGATLYQAAVEIFNIPAERQGVPALIVGDTVLVGSLEIPGQFPGIIEKGLAGGGIDWPKLPNLDTHIQNRAAQIQPSATDQLWSLFQRDLAANTLALIILVGLVITLIYNLHFFNVQAFSNRSKKKAAANEQPAVNWFIPTLIVIGLAVAIYMTYVEVTDTSAVCGPIGDCNTVQQSPYAKIFGILSIGVFGIFGYICLSGAWLLYHFGPQAYRNYGAYALFGFAIFGVCFASYLTFLEPFVIGASCSWCLTTAVIMGLLLWLATKPAILAWNVSHVKVHRRH